MTFETMRLVIIGYGFSSQAIVSAVAPLFSSIDVTTRSPERRAMIHAQAHASHLFAHIFDASTVAPALETALVYATHLIISAPPDARGDPSLLHLDPVLRRASQLKQVIYLSTVGVYGDHQGAWVDETTPLKPVSLRSLQRVQAEEAWQSRARDQGFDLAIFRLSGIYGPGRSAIENLRAGSARRIIKPGQVFNRIHVADIAGAAKAVMETTGPLGVFNVTDSEPAPPQDVVAYGARIMGVPIPPDIPFEAANLSDMGRSFYGENKLVSNEKLRETLGYRFMYPSYREGLSAILASDQAALLASPP